MNKKFLILLFCITLITTTFLVIKYFKNNKDDNYQERAQNKESETESDQEKENLPIVTKNNQKGSYWPKIILALIIFVVVIALIFIVYLIKNSHSKKKEVKKGEGKLIPIEEEKKIFLYYKDNAIKKEKKKEGLIPIKEVEAEEEEEKKEEEEKNLNSAEQKKGKFDVNANEKIEFDDYQYINNLKDYSIMNLVLYGNKTFTYNSLPIFLCYNVKTSELISAEYKKSFYFQCSNDQIQLDDNYLLLFALLPIKNHFSFIWENENHRKFVQEKLRQLSIICLMFDNELKDIINEACGQNHPFRLLTEFDQFSYSPSNPNTNFFQLITPKNIKSFNKKLTNLNTDLNNGKIEGIFEYATYIVESYYKLNKNEKIPCFKEDAEVPFKNLIVLLGIFKQVSRLFGEFYDQYPQLTDEQTAIVNKKEKVNGFFSEVYNHLFDSEYMLRALPI